MNPALFVFIDDEGTSCVYVHRCDHSAAKQMGARTLADKAASPIKYYEALEFSTTFVAANKTRPYDLLFVGDINTCDIDDEEVSAIYEVSVSSEMPNALSIFVSGEHDMQEAWILKPTYIH